MKRIFIMFAVTILVVSVCSAQDRYAAPEGATFTFTNALYSNDIHFSEAEWQTDSQSFRFTYRQFERLLAFQYFIPTNELQIIDYSICALFFSDTQAKAFQASNCPQTMSPNGQYVIYPLEEQICGEACSHILALGDLETNHYLPIRKGPDSGYYVRWSEDSSAFLLLDYGQTAGLGGISYGTVPLNFAAESDLQTTLLANFPHGDIGYIDISPDGRRVLIRGTSKTRNGFSLWDAGFPSTNQQFTAWADGQPHLENDVIAGASFIPNDPRHVLVVVDAGLVLYDLEVSQMALIDPAINTQWADWTYFSPDMRYAFVYDRFGEEGQQQISLFPIDIMTSHSTGMQNNSIA